GLSAKTLHTLRDISLEADARLLAVVHDVDAGGGLLGNHMAHSGFALARKLGLVDRFAGFVADQEAGHNRIARQAADMLGEDAFIASLHVNPPWLQPPSRPRPT